MSDLSRDRYFYYGEALIPPSIPEAKKFPNCLHAMTPSLTILLVDFFPNVRAETSCEKKIIDFGIDAMWKSLY